MNALVETQIANNGATSANWSAFASHRLKVTALLRARRAASKLCVLGAGNCNDLDLNALAASHAAIHLVDLDAASLTRALERQNVRADVRLHAPVDISGRFAALAHWTPSTTLTPADISSCRDSATEVAGKLPGPFAMTASVCVLSQLMDSLSASLGASHPRFAEAVGVTRLGHLSMMAKLTAPGGEAILIADVVSSATCPGLADITDEGALAELLAQAVRARNFFHGMNPAALAADLATDGELRRAFEPPRWLKPWVWNLGLRHYLVHAVSLTKRGSSV